MFDYTINRHLFDLMTLQTNVFNNISNNVISIQGTYTSVTVSFSIELTLTQQNALSTLVLNYTDSINDDDGISFLSKINKRHAVLSANETWEGSWEDISKYASLTINCITDKKGILTLKMNNDAQEEQFVKSYLIKPNIAFIEIKTITYRYYKITYTNDFEDQTKFCLHTMAHLYKSKSINDTSEVNAIAISEETVATGGNFRSESYPLVIAANSSNSLSYIKKYRVSVLELRFSTEENQKNDVLNAFVAKNTAIGVLGSNAIIGNTSFYVSPTVIQYLQVGYVLAITDGVNSQELGDCEYISGNNVSFTDALLYNFSVGSAIKMSVQNIRNYTIGHANTYIIGASKSGSSSIPANTLLTLEYTNNSSTEKTLYFYYDYLY